MQHQTRQDRHRAREAERRTRAQTAGAVVGVDAGKFHHALVVRPRGGIDSKPLTFPTTRDGFDRAVEFILTQTGGTVPEETLVGIEFAGVYGFTLAHYLHQKGFRVVNVLGAHTKAWNTVKHRKRLKTDEKDAATILDLVVGGNYGSFPFLQPVYAELRYLVSGRERLSRLRNASLTRLKSTLQVVFPEFESIFKDLQKPTAVAMLRTFPSPRDLLEAPRGKVLKVLHKASRGHLGEETCTKLLEAATTTLALPGSTEPLTKEVHQLLDQVKLYTQQIKDLESAMVELMRDMPEAQALMTIPGVAPVSAAVFLGCLGDPRAYESARQVLALCGMSLTEASSGTHQGQVRLSKSGRPLLRRFSFMLALKAIRGRDGLYRAQFERMLKRNGPKRKMPAVIAVAREMVCLMYAIARDRRTFTAEPPQRVSQRTNPAAS